ncbi:hypothetical protein KS4_33610 [Poriferisphaera corsica]|uniref:DUF2806 domain-containing protein n=1 Tax=Poriferisphaera corsica TaxID=2528020 RepID=A0A517YYI1_9BACT|nr:DUF2806 domain-containing protein [Poriferisphaera corsica]QDU35280.1 hypothetical protein KS4_33610 [Poriferisphaera corsica]
METGITLLGDLGKPATALVEKIGVATGILYEPTRIKRKARAEAKAEHIKAIAKIDQGRQVRALQRFIAEEERKQENMESIIEQAFPLIDDNAKPKAIENDWLLNFFEKCRLTSDQDIQKIWAAILAGEANTNGNFSKRTINCLADFDSRDAMLLQHLCTFAVTFNQDQAILIYSFQDRIYDGPMHIYELLQHFQSFGLLSINNINFYNLEYPSIVDLKYFSKNKKIHNLDHSYTKINIGKALLSRTGCELIKVCKSSPEALEYDKFYAYMIDRLKNQKLSIY